ncbi:SufD family Fe-S cluster assembly protein [Candidatus Peregrinibacteria bacterium]|jgi:Fe-S cluster assembly protein SufD|nr:SufD family Fe-S cluster assembly protein [Candidatus Peregrinibacteria bacterium]MBT3598302.1 SufD family Fe-S cluster assembly protein [Candidatus Peregrinibacteria bacterium]MBT4367215.1 SufD family Fe-S cluster assembly protein [Candidatus Peregrinibacteria bacterium]MBT4586242.1 SufD family Fe-S cluster assembly protein [Candidatus Peregrinibacteria bacterium]MBT6731025.1 SufD family Fe-S cluster assembly protein [Candidatus Peregrinibacteria bacterium]
MNIDVTKSIGNVEEHLIQDENAQIDIHIHSGVKSTLLIRFEEKVRKAKISIQIDEKASLLFLVLQPNINEGAHVHITHECIVSDSSEINCMSLLFNGNTTYELVSNIKGSNSTSNIDVISYANAESDQHISIKNIFNSNNGKGDINVRSIAQNKAKIKCDGDVHISSNGDGTCANLLEEILLLDKECRAKAVPMLHIYSNSVTSSHSASVTKIPEDDYFTFASRGIEEKEAKRMYAEGFLCQGICDMPKNTKELLLDQVRMNICI